MKNAAVDRAIGKIVITSDSERVPTTEKRYASALLVVHLLNRLSCPLCPFCSKAFLLFLFPSVIFHLQFFGALPAFVLGQGAPLELRMAMKFLFGLEPSRTEQDANSLKHC